MSTAAPVGIRTADKIALITRLSERFGGDGQLGKKALQKIVHLLEEGFNFRTGYSFSLYTYGAFSRDLAGDLDIARGIGGVKVDYISSENRYVVTGGPAVDAIKAKAPSYLSALDGELDRFDALFGKPSVRQLELASTLVFLLRRRRSDQDDREIVEQLVQLKPKYSIDEAARELDGVKRLIAS
ncbi:hypothetical protein [Enterovirga sp. CN4-39]|uniref:hypothetical protein n=1 Tax=Enterovirga sp. CN4-39 TaxID=3400910 RepID=UPI003BFBCE8F